MENGFTRGKVKKNWIGRAMDSILGNQTGGYIGQINAKNKQKTATVDRFNGTDANLTVTKRAKVKDRVIKNRG